jgi:UDP-N-acetylmuramate dehydrogenase
VTAVEWAMADTEGVLHDEPLARYTSWRVGGTADIFFRPQSTRALQDFLATLAAETALTWIGLGSNLLVRDGGIRGAVVAMSKMPRLFERIDTRVVRAGAGLPCAVLARRAARLELGPAAFFAGIPGTVGGALAMNAGAFGGETWDRVQEVETIDRAGILRRRRKADYAIAYRNVTGPPGEWFLSADFAFEPQAGSPANDIKKLLDKRGSMQPIGTPSAGSVFRNPDSEHAAELIERAGLKGLQIGGAVVSDKHANFIINDGTATAADIEALIERVRTTVAEKYAVVLESEVRILGEHLGEHRGHNSEGPA